MEGGRRSSAALLFLALALAATSIGAVAQLQPPAGKRYILIALLTGRGSDAKLAMKTGDGVSMPGFANKKQQWFAVTGSKDLVPPGSNSYRRDITGGLGLVTLLGALLNNGGTR